MAYDLTDSEPISLYPEADLRSFAKQVLTALGASDEEAEIVTDGVVTAALRWHPGQGQGLEKLFRYRRRIEEGGIVVRAAMDWLTDGPSYALLDAANGFGYVAAQRAMRKAVEKAKQSGIGMVGVRRSNHFGIAGYHAMTAAQEGFIGWAMTNARSEMAPWGSAQVVLATNPWGMALPVPNEDGVPVVLDMALTMSGKGMMRWYLEQGLEIPDSWALTPDGRVTTDPAAAMDGPLLPIGEYKGYGLSFITDVLTGVMTGAKFGLSVFRDEQDYDVGHMMVAFNPEVFMPRSEFNERLERLVLEVKSAPPIDPEKPDMLPGEIEHRRTIERQREGVPIANETVSGLRRLAHELGVSSPF
ncbi:MAG: Ldh family oxidoreductase [Trueperaceae bacterium]|nr:MAG: Ldh family oxidoreductase [Trueperaceae bacterium]